MFKKKLEELGAELFGAKVEDAWEALKVLEETIPFTETHRKILIEFGGAVVFRNGSKFQSDEWSPLSDGEGYLDLGLLYGLAEGKHGLCYLINVYEEQLPELLVPIGDSSGGNLICLDNSGAVYFWDHESSEGENGTNRIADSFDEFFYRLETEQDMGDSEGIDESRTWFDF